MFQNFKKSFKVIKFIYIFESKKKIIYNVQLFYKISITIMNYTKEVVTKLKKKVLSKNKIFK